MFEYVFRAERGHMTRDGVKWKQNKKMKTMYRHFILLIFIYWKQEFTTLNTKLSHQGEISACLSKIWRATDFDIEKVR